MLYDPEDKKAEEQEKFKKITHKATLLERIEAKLRSLKMVVAQLI